MIINTLPWAPIPAGVGKKWLEFDMPGTYTWSDICYGYGRFVAISTGSDKSAYSSDGMSWTLVDLPSSQSWVKVAYIRDHFLAVAANGVTASSFSGTSWDVQGTISLAVGETINNVINFNGNHVVLTNKKIWLDNWGTWEAASVAETNWYYGFPDSYQGGFTFFGSTATDLTILTLGNDSFDEPYLSTLGDPTTFIGGYPFLGRSIIASPTKLYFSGNDDGNTLPTGTWIKFIGAESRAFLFSTNSVSVASKVLENSNGDLPFAWNNYALPGSGVVSAAYGDNKLVAITSAASFVSTPTMSGIDLPNLDAGSIAVQPDSTDIFQQIEPQETLLEVLVQFDKELNTLYTKNYAYHADTSMTLAAANFVGASAPYTLTYSISGLTTYNKVFVAPRTSGTSTQRADQIAAFGKISYCTVEAGQLVFTCLDEKPTVDIPVQCLILQFDSSSENSIYAYLVGSGGGGSSASPSIGGTSTFNGTTGRTITHNLGSTSYHVSVTPTADSSLVGEIWVTNASNTCTIYCSGSGTSAFSYLITPYGG